MNDSPQGTAASGPVSASAVRAASDVRTVMSRLRRRLKQVAEVDDLTPSQTAVLSRLLQDGADTTSGLAAGERVRPQSMAATVAVLEERGLVRRDPDPEDGRKQLVSLTEQAREMIAGDRRARQEWLARVLQDTCTEAERRNLIEALAVLDRISQT